MNYKASLILVLLFFNFYAKAQEEKEPVLQTVRGIVYDNETQKIISNVSVFEEKAPSFGVITNSKGEFTLQIPIGRKSIIFTHLGYQSKIINLFLNTSQASELTVFLEPSIVDLSEVTLFQKEKKSNKFVFSGGRSFSTEEAYRYAGTLGDPARMVRAYPGVIPSDDNRNDIVIRGNSPIGLLWRVDDVEISNPNHFANTGLTGSTLTLLNPKMITNSDFILSTFPAEYGNATAGVFDLKLKKGNSENREFRVGVGWNGLELASEGPFSKKSTNNNSYIVSYRYSFLDLINKVGLDLGVLPKYQDLTTKLDFNLSETLELSVLGLWGTSQIMLDERENNEDIAIGQVVNTGSDTYIGSAKLIYKPNDQTNYIFNFSINSSKSSSQIDEFNTLNSSLRRIAHTHSLEKKYAFFTQFETFKIKNNHLKIGVRADLFDLDFDQRFLFNENIGLETAVNQEGRKMNLMRTYVQDVYYFSRKLKATGGIHFQYLDLNNSSVIEPRGAISYRFNNLHSISIAYGKHSQMQTRALYFTTFDKQNSSNENLDFTKADHYGFTYNWQLSKNWRTKIELYYQSLYDIPIENNMESIFSTINTGADYYVPLVEELINKGKGLNYGLEITLEKFFSKHSYFMLNSSFFQSKYKTLSNIWYDTEFNLDHITNAIWGKEFPINNSFTLGMDIKATFAGGKPYTPVLENESIEAGELIYQNEAPFSKTHNPYFRTDLKLYYKINTQKTYMTFAVDFQNLTNHDNIYRQRFDLITKTYKTFYQQKFFPMFTFELLF